MFVKKISKCGDSLLNLLDLVVNILFTVRLELLGFV
jgi:hypothetical protein